MSSSEATRRASSTALSEQQPPCFADSSVSPRGHCCSVTPTTSWPWACRSAAATDESTPPDIATATLTCATLRCGGRRSRRPPPPPRRSTTFPSPTRARTCNKRLARLFNPSPSSLKPHPPLPPTSPHPQPTHHPP